MSPRLHRILLGAALVAPLLASAAVPPGPHYNISRSMPDRVLEIDLNNAGEVAGYYRRILDGYRNGVAGFWQNSDGSYRNLDVIATDAQLRLSAINDNGGIAGRLAPEDDGAALTAFFLASAGASRVDIPPAAGMTAVAPTDLSNRNAGGGWYVAGTATMETGTHAFRWSVNGSAGQGATMVDLGTLGGPNSTAAAVNAAGMVTGWAQATPIAGGHAFLYDNGTMRDLDALAGADVDASFGSALNEAGTVVGGAYDGTWTAVMYRQGNMLRLGDLGGGVSAANDINNHGTVVGWATLPLAQRVGFIYLDGEMIDLNTLVDPASGWHILEASAVNDAGQILAFACGTNAPCNYLLLTPVPEPAAWTLLLGGLPMLAALRCRRERALAVLVRRRIGP